MTILEILVYKAEVENCAPKLTQRTYSVDTNLIRPDFLRAHEVPDSQAECLVNWDEDSSGVMARATVPDFEHGLYLACLLRDKNVSNKHAVFEVDLNSNVVAFFDEARRISSGWDSNSTISIIHHDVKDKSDYKPVIEFMKNYQGGREAFDNFPHKILHVIPQSILPYYVHHAMHLDHFCIVHDLTLNPKQ